MNKTATATDAAATESEEVQIDPTMIPGHPLWQPEKYFKTQKMVTVFARGDRMNPQFTEDTLSINGYPWTFKYDQPEVMPYAFAAILESSGRGQIVAS